ncbi:hypothetical protein L2E82_24576 [Cichorium intybus]|uniref:Uncharacterized protein n=1 Tax=Cichorium intybus TaxID=13427 RepID=A0ACB9E188_CICIN|nr:hypothetical protein L2E82_24576 [Cichorium intybus]
MCSLRTESNRIVEEEVYGREILTVLNMKVPVLNMKVPKVGIELIADKAEFTDDQCVNVIVSSGQKLKSTVEEKILGEDDDGTRGSSRVRFLCTKLLLQILILTKLTLASKKENETWRKILDSSCHF